MTTAPASAPANTQQAKPATQELRNPVKRVLMPLDKKPEAQKSTQPATTTPGTSVPNEQQRPRRIQP
jgi:hypothetical protein